MKSPWPTVSINSCSSSRSVLLGELMPKRDQKSVANVTSNLEKHKREVIENGRFKIQHNNMRFLSHKEWGMIKKDFTKKRKTFRRGGSVKGYWFKDRSCKRENALI